MNGKALAVVLLSLVLATQFLPHAARACSGDCDEDGSVTVDELVHGIDIALSQFPMGECESFDRDANGQVTIDELVSAVENTLYGCPSVTSFEPASAAPGSEITVYGHGFIRDNRPRRVLVLIDAGVGTEISLPPDSTTSTTLRLLLPPIPLPNSNEWYQGPAQVCVVVDGQAACAEQMIGIQPRAVPVGNPGDTLVRWSRENAGPLLSVLDQLGPATDADRLRGLLDDWEQELRALIAAANSETPGTFRATDDQGVETELVFNRDAVTLIQDVESLLAASMENAGLPGPVSSVSPIVDSCALDGEKSREAAKLIRDTAANLLVVEQRVFLVLPIIAAGVAGAACDCVAGAVAAYKVTGEVLTFALIGAEIPAIFAQVRADSEANWLASLSVGPSEVDLRLEGAEAFAQQPFVVTGIFTPRGGTLPREVSKAIFAEAIALSFPKPTGGTGADLWVLIRNDIAKFIVDLVVGNFLDKLFPPTLDPRPMTFELGRHSCRALPDSYPEVSVTLACGGQGIPSFAFATDGTPQTRTFGILADKGNLLIPDAGVSAAILHVSVERILPATPTATRTLTPTPTPTVRQTPSPTATRPQPSATPTLSLTTATQACDDDCRAAQRICGNDLFYQEYGSVGECTDECVSTIEDFAIEVSNPNECIDAQVRFIQCCTRQGQCGVIPDGCDSEFYDATTACGGGFGGCPLIFFGD